MLIGIGSALAASASSAPFLFGLVAAALGFAPTSSSPSSAPSCYSSSASASEGHEGALADPYAHERHRVLCDCETASGASSSFSSSSSSSSSSAAQREGPWGRTSLSLLFALIMS